MRTSVKVGECTRGPPKKKKKKKKEEEEEKFPRLCCTTYGRALWLGPSHSFTYTNVRANTHSRVGMLAPIVPKATALNYVVIPSFAVAVAVASPSPCPRSPLG
jgi:hypothetical protein